MIARLVRLQRQTNDRDREHIRDGDHDDNVYVEGLVRAVLGSDDDVYDSDGDDAGDRTSGCVCILDSADGYSNTILDYNLPISRSLRTFLFLTLILLVNLTTCYQHTPGQK